MSGARFVILTGALARLERALTAFMMDLQTQEHGYQEVSPPALVREAALYGTGQLPKFAEDLFQTTDGYWLIPTAEVPLTNLVAGEVQDDGTLPQRLHRSHAVLSGGSRCRRPRQSRHDPHASVQQGRTGIDHPSGRFGR